jgi:hypothetical protein
MGKLVIVWTVYKGMGKCIILIQLVKDWQLRAGGNQTLVLVSHHSTEQVKLKINYNK